MRWRRILNIIIAPILPGLGIAVGYYYRVWESWVFWLIAPIAVAAALFCMLAPNKRPLVLVKVACCLAFFVVAFAGRRSNQFLIVDAGIFAMLLLAIPMYTKHKARSTTGNKNQESDIVFFEREK